MLARHRPHLERGLGEAQQARRADRVRRQHAARHVHGERSVERGVAPLDHLPALGRRRDVVGFEPHRLVPAERHVDLGAVDLVPRVGDARLPVDVPRAVDRALRPHRVATRERVRLRSHGRPEDPRGLPPGPRRGLAAIAVGHHHRARAVRRRARLEEADRVPHHRGGLHLLDRDVGDLQMRVRVLQRVQAVLDRDHRPDVERRTGALDVRA